RAGRWTDVARLGAVAGPCSQRRDRHGAGGLGRRGAVGIPPRPGVSRGPFYFESVEDGDAVVGGVADVCGRRVPDQVDRARLLLPYCGAGVVVARSIETAVGTWTSAWPRPRRRTLFRLGGGGRGADRLECPARYRCRRGDQQAESIRPPGALSLARGA